MTAETKVVKFTFYRTELLYDISNTAFVEGDVMTDENEHAKHQTIDITQDGNIDRVTRIINLAFAECVEFMHPYTKTPIEGDEHYNDIQTAPETYEVSLNLPTSSSKTTTDLLSKLIHEYLVCRVLSEWLSTTNPNAANKWLIKTSDVESAIKSSLSRTRRRVRLSLNPF